MSAFDNKAPWPARRMRVVDCCVLHGELQARNQAIDAWDGGGVGERQVYNESLFPSVFPDSYVVNFNFIFSSTRPQSLLERGKTYCSGLHGLEDIRYKNVGGDNTEPFSFGFSYYELFLTMLLVQAIGLSRHTRRAILCATLK